MANHKPQVTDMTSDKKTAEKRNYAPQITALKDVPAEHIRLMGMAYRKEIPVKQALMGCGISEAQASKGWTLVKSRRSLRDALAAARAEELYQVNPESEARTNAEQDIALINSRLRLNIQSGTDKAVQSCKVLGSRKDLNMWSPDSIAGVVILEAPRSLPALPAESE